MHRRRYETPITQAFIAEANLEGGEHGKRSALQCLLFWIEVERYRCCTSQWQPGSGFPEAYAAWIQGKYVSTGMLGVDVGNMDLDTDLVCRVWLGNGSVCSLAAFASRRSELSIAPNTWCFSTSNALCECTASTVHR